MRSASLRPERRDLLLLAARRVVLDDCGDSDHAVVAPAQFVDPLDCVDRLLAAKHLGFTRAMLGFAPLEVAHVDRREEGHRDVGVAVIGLKFECCCGHGRAPFGLPAAATPT